MKKKEVVLTGYSVKELGKHLKQSKKKDFHRCFLYKRSEQDESVFFRENEVGFASVDLSWLEIKREDLTFKILLCQECHMLLSSLLDKVEFPQSLIMSQSRN